MFKIKVKEFSINYTKQNAKSKHDIIDKLEKDIDILNSALKEMDSFVLSSKRDNLRKDVFNIISEKATGAQIHAQATYVEEGEKSISYFLRLEKHRQSNNKITELLINDRIIDDDGEIIDQCKMFYETLYSSTKPNFNHIGNNLKHCNVNNVLTEEQKTLCDEPMTLEECTTFINKYMKSNKSPGLDRLPVEFYRAFWPKLGPFLIKVYHESLKHGSFLSPSQRKGVRNF